MKTNYHRIARSMPWLKGMRCSLAAKLVAALIMIATLLLMPDAALALTEVSNFGSNPGDLRMYRYVPANLPASAPLVVALHGCTQSAANYDDETGWVKLADQYQFALLLPEQKDTNNSNRCFNWFKSGDIQRGQGEALSIKQMVDKMKSDYPIATQRVYVTGLSAGGAMTSVMLATYPDVFAGGGIVAGLPYQCATSVSDAFNCMNPGKTLNPDQWGDKVRQAYSGYQGPWPIVSIWHGDADSTVKVSNLTEILKQWTNVHGIDQLADREEKVVGYPHKVYQDASGKALVETYTITGMAHGTPINPGAGERQCGKPGAFILDKDICSSYYISQFWGLISPTPVLNVKITSPTEGMAVSGSVPIEVTATGPVQRVAFYADSNLLGEDATAPYTYSWDASTVEKGSHKLVAKAYDSAGSAVTSGPVSVTVNGGGPTRMTFSNDDRQDGYVKANADGSTATVGPYENWFGLAIGRGADGRFNRAVLSFNTSAIPDPATITKACLVVAPGSTSGNPWADPAGNQLVVDVQRGCFADCAIEAGDWSTPATASSVAKFMPFTAGNQNSEAFNPEGLAAINKTGTTQVKLRFSQNQTSTNYLWLTPGATAKLYVEYLQ